MKITVLVLWVQVHYPIMMLLAFPFWERKIKRTTGKNKGLKSWEKRNKVLLQD